MIVFTDFLSTLNSLQIAGVAGFVIYLWIFAAVQFGVMNGNSAAYSLGNVLAASLVALSLIADFNLASALIQGSWIIIGLTGLILRHRKSQTTKLTQFGAFRYPRIEQ